GSCFCFSRKALKPPIASDWISAIDPERSMMATISTGVWSCDMCASQEEWPAPGGLGHAWRACGGCSAACSPRTLTACPAQALPCLEGAGELVAQLAIERAEHLELVLERLAPVAHGVLDQLQARPQLGGVIAFQQPVEVVRQLGLGLGGTLARHALRHACGGLGGRRPPGLGGGRFGLLRHGFLARGRLGFGSNRLGHPLAWRGVQIDACLGLRRGTGDRRRDAVGSRLEWHGLPRISGAAARLGGWGRSWSDRAGG